MIVPKRILVAAETGVPPSAVLELRRLLPGSAIEVAERPAPVSGDAVLARITHPVAQRHIRSGRTGLHNQNPAKDPYHVFTDDGVLWLLGGSARGVMQAVHAVSESSMTVPPDLHGAFTFPYRILTPFVHGDLFDARKTDGDKLHQCMRYLSLAGASHVAVTHDFAGPRVRSPHTFVESSVFPESSTAGERQSHAARLREIIKAASRFGLGILYDANLLPCQGGPWRSDAERARLLHEFPEDVLSPSGTYQGKVLCFGHPRVRAFYAEVIAKFLATFPEIELFHYLGMDANGEFCDPETCPRCRGLSKMDQRDRLSRFLAEHMAEARPGIRVLNSGFEWDREAFGVPMLLDRQSRMPPEVGLCMPATGDSATFDRQATGDLRRAREVTWKTGQLVLGRDATHVFEDQLHGLRQRYDYPFGVFAKVRRWLDLGYDGFYDVRGRQSVHDMHVNGPALRQALLGNDPRVFVNTLSREWFGGEAAPLVEDAWNLLERAQAIRSNGYAFPSGSPLSEYVPWHFTRTFTPVPAEPEFTPGPIPQRCPDLGELPPVDANGFVYREGDYPHRLMNTGRALIEGAALVEQAAQLIAKAESLPLPDSISAAALWLGEGSGCSPADYLGHHHRFLECQVRFWSSMGPYFVLKGLRMICGDDSHAYGREAGPWLRQYAAGNRALADYLDRLALEGRLTVKLSESQSPEVLREKARKVDDYLAVLLS